MTRTEKKKCIKKSTRLYTISYLLITLFILFIVLMFTVGDPVRELIKDNMWGSLIFVMVLISPIFAALYVSTLARWESMELYKAKRDLEDRRNKLHLKFFWYQICSGNYDEAKRLYNLEGYIKGSERILCNGVLMGIAKVTGIDKDWKEKVDERMADYYNTEES